MGRIKEFDRGKSKKRKRLPVIYIVCEGSETEPKYFAKFRTRNCNIIIHPIISTDKSASGLVQKAEKMLGNNPYYPEDGDVIWCVFDCDENTDSMLKSAQEFAKAHGYRIAFSNPCIEYWYLLHYTLYNGYLANCDAVLTQLRKKNRIPDYTKTADVYGLLLPLQGKAIENANKRRKQLGGEQVHLLSRKSNPYTNMDMLVEFLNECRLNGQS